MKQLNRPLRYGICLILGLVVGVGSAVIGINRIVNLGSVQNGIWQANWTTGGEDAGMYTRAYIAINGLFALNKKEVIYMNADADAAGDPLISNCDYRLQGGLIEARWWSITAYDEKRFLIPNPRNRYAFSGQDLIVGEQTKYTVHLSSSPKSDPWLPIGKTGRFYLTLRIYMPEKNVYEQLSTYPLPRLIKEECR